MKVFVTGGTGVVGRRAVPVLVGAGHAVTAVSRREESDRWLRGVGAEPAAVDLFDPSAVEAAVAGHDAVVNLATHIPPVSKAARSSAWATNDRLRREASRHLVDAALAADAGVFVQESICFPYADGGDAWVTEESPLEHGPATITAGVAEDGAARFTGDGGRGVVLRFAQFYAADSSHVVAFNRMARLRINPFIGPPQSFASFVHADDAGSAVAAALEVPAGIYNVGDDEPLRRADAGVVVAEVVGARPPRRLPEAVLGLMPAPARQLMRSVRVSNAKLRQATGWRPAYPSIREGWSTTVDRGAG